MIVHQIGVRVIESDAAADVYFGHFAAGHKGRQGLIDGSSTDFRQAVFGLGQQLAGADMAVNASQALSNYSPLSSES